jgi:hypothetical protein
MQFFTAVGLTTQDMVNLLGRIFTHLISKINEWLLAQLCRRYIVYGLDGKSNCLHYYIDDPLDLQDVHMEILQ